jgi:hypothetical protein
MLIDPAFNVVDFVAKPDLQIDWVKAGLRNDDSGLQNAVSWVLKVSMLGNISSDQSKPMIPTPQKGRGIAQRFHDCFRVGQCRCAN